MINSITSTLRNIPSYISLLTSTYSLNVFTVTSISYIDTIVKETKSSSPLNTIPLSLIHKSTESLSIPLNNIFCESLESA